MASSRIKLRLRQAVNRVRAMSTPFRFDLLALPDELIAGVLEQLDDWDSLLNTALTCKRLHSLAEREIYRALLVRSGEEAALLVAALRRLPIRAKLLKRLNLSCDAYVLANNHTGKHHANSNTPEVRHGRILLQHGGSSN